MTLIFSISLLSLIDTVSISFVKKGEIHTYSHYTMTDAFRFSERYSSVIFKVHYFQNKFLMILSLWSFYS